MVVRLGLPKIKSRSAQPVVQQCATSIEYYNGVPTGNTYVGSLVTVDSGLAEKIVYTTRQKGFRHLSNMCAHTKNRTWYTGSVKTLYRIQNIPQVNLYGYSLSWCHPYGATGHAISVTQAKAALPSSGVNFLAANAQAFINTATSQLRPDLTTLSVPNFLLELGQIKSLYRIFKNRAGLVGDVAATHLGWKFGWKPFLGDLQNLYDAVQALHNRLKAWNKHIGVIFKGHTKVLTDTTTKIGTYSIDASTRVNWTGTLTRSAKAHITWQPLPLAVMTPFEQSLRVILDTIGVQLNPRIVWDALPFSFVLDWFFDIGSFLENFSIDTLELPVSYIDSCVDYKETLRIESSTINEHSSWAPRIDLPAWVTDESLFQRMPIFADYATLSGLGGRVPKLGQGLLMLSLATVLGKRS